MRDDLKELSCIVTRAYQSLLPELVTSQLINCFLSKSAKKIHWFKFLKHKHLMVFLI